MTTPTKPPAPSPSPESASGGLPSEHSKDCRKSLCDQGMWCYEQHRRRGTVARETAAPAPSDAAFREKLDKYGDARAATATRPIGDVDAAIRLTGAENEARAAVESAHRAEVEELRRQRDNARTSERAAQAGQAGAERERDEARAEVHDWKRRYNEQVEDKHRIATEYDAALRVARAERDKYRHLMYESDETAERRLQRLSSAESSAKGLREAVARWIESHEYCCPSRVAPCARHCEPLREALAIYGAALSPSPAPLAEWYEADGSVTMLPAEEVVRRRKIAAKVIAAARAQLAKMDRLQDAVDNAPRTAGFVPMPRDQRESAEHKALRSALAALDASSPTPGASDEGANVSRLVTEAKALIADSRRAIDEYAKSSGVTFIGREPAPCCCHEIGGTCALCAPAPSEEKGGEGGTKP